MANKIPCAQCQQPFEPNPKRKDHRFCHDKCRTAWHRANKLHGQVTGIRALKNGGWSVTIHQPDQPAVKIGSMVRLETDA